MKHLAVFKENLAEEILSGKRLVEVRSSKGKVLPFGQISSGDLVYIKPVGKDIIGQFRVQKVIFFDGLSRQDVEEIKSKYNGDIAVGARYATLIFISDSVRFLTSPIKLPKKSVKSWVVLT